jgi:hypothetical protein
MESSHLPLLLTLNLELFEADGRKVGGPGGKDASILFLVDDFSAKI